MNLVEKLALGTVQFGLDYGISNDSGMVGSDMVRDILKEAKKWNIDTLDTARAYGNSEDILGEVGVDSFKLVSKYLINDADQDLSTQLKESLKKLNQENLYGYLSHSAEILLANPSHYELLRTYQTSGLISKIGVSLYHPSELERIIKTLGVPDLIQIPYNPLDVRFQPYFEELKSKGVEIHVRSAFLQGLFFMDPKQLSSFFDPVKGYLKKLMTLIPEPNHRAAALLAFGANNPAIDKVVFGVNTIQQLVENCRLLKEKDWNLEAEKTSLPEEMYLPYLWPTKTK